FRSILAPDEKERAARFHFEHLRSAFIAARGVLRCLLGGYLNRHPGRVQFRYGARGKPALEPDAGIEFNLAHSGGLAVLAFASGCPIGVDLEQIRPIPELREIAARFFCAEEAAEIASLPSGERQRSFFRCWTRKEAYIKATGDGLSAPLDQFR